MIFDDYKNSILMARDFLELCVGDLKVPKKIRLKAAIVLNHFPGEAALEMMCGGVSENQARPKRTDE